MTTLKIGKQSPGMLKMMITLFSLLSLILNTDFIGTYTAILELTFNAISSNQVLLYLK